MSRTPHNATVTAEEPVRTLKNPKYVRLKKVENIVYETVETADHKRCLSVKGRTETVSKMKGRMSWYIPSQ
jgi:hypothetical protein